jgi:hypothetical protein
MRTFLLGLLSQARITETPMWCFCPVMARQNGRVEGGSGHGQRDTCHPTRPHPWPVTEHHICKWASERAMSMHSLALAHWLVSWRGNVENSRLQSAFSGLAMNKQSDFDVIPSWSSYLPDWRSFRGKSTIFCLLLKVLTVSLLLLVAWG